MRQKIIKIIPAKLKCQRGVTIIYVSLITLPILLGMGAISVDIGNLITARNELKNAADAGALAGGWSLYAPDGSGVDTGANQEAYNAATANYSQKQPVEVDINADVQRGHWSFGSRTFTPNNATTSTDLWGVDEATLDADLNHINAIRVRTHRKAAPVASWFSRIFGQEGFVVARTSVAYLGFAGAGGGQADTPFAPCSKDIVDDQGNFSCNVGRMHGGGSGLPETGAWTNFKECGNNPSANELKGMVCDSGNGILQDVAQNMDVNNGVVTSALKAWRKCWDQETPILATMPVIDCPNGIRPCHEVVGTVKAWIVWMTDSGNKFNKHAPKRMDGIPSLGIPDWTCDCSKTSQASWDDFTDHFRLETPDGRPIKEAPNHGLAKKTIYFIPSCDSHAPAGGTGDQNFGVMAQNPRLVDIESSDTIL